MRRVQEFGLRVEHFGLAAGCPTLPPKTWGKGGIEAYPSLHELPVTDCLKIAVVVSLNPRLEHVQLCRHQIGSLKIPEESFSAGRQDYFKHGYLIMN